jgi:homocitrate synthase NifV
MPSERPVILKDSTLREGLDTPGVAFGERPKLRIANALVAAGVTEAEVVAPSRVREDLSFVRTLKRRGIPLRASGLIYANGPWCAQELDDCGVSGLDRVDLLMPLSEHREPREPGEKVERLLAALAHRVSRRLEVGVGFPHAMQADADFLVDIGRRAVAAGATRVTVYDTNGGADPSAVGTLVRRLIQGLGIRVFFHGHNDLGMATANSWSAVVAGAAGLDVTVNGLGDRAGNASLEQVATLLQVRGFTTGVRLRELPKLSRLVARLSGVVIPPLAPVVGAYVFAHKSPSHLKIPTEFEAFDPDLIGARRRLERAPRRSLEGAARRHT